MNKLYICQIVIKIPYNFMIQWINHTGILFFKFIMEFRRFIPKHFTKHTILITDKRTIKQKVYFV